MLIGGKKKLNEKTSSNSENIDIDIDDDGAGDDGDGDDGDDTKNENENTNENENENELDDDDDEERKENKEIKFEMFNNGVIDVDASYDYFAGFTSCGCDCVKQGGFEFEAVLRSSKYDKERKEKEKQI